MTKTDLMIAGLASSLVVAGLTGYGIAAVGLVTVLTIYVTVIIGVVGIMVIDGAMQRDFPSGKKPDQKA